MALPLSGPLSLSQIQTEFGGTNPISMSEYYRGGPFVTTNNTGVPTSGAISIGNFYGANNQFAFTISSNQTNANLRTLAINAGWNQSSRVVATIANGIIISSNSTGTPALTVNGSFPNGVELVNNGVVVGMGGAGGKGGAGATASGPATAGGAGGLALSVAVAISVNNAGTIAGGGGGGGGGASYANSSGEDVYPGDGGGGGGGQSSAAANSAGGSNGGNGPYINGSPGSAGTYSAAGAGGIGGKHQGPTVLIGGTGGSGGSWGNAGATGGNTNGTVAFPAASGGAAGGAVSGNSNITWIAFGTRLGPIS